MGEIDDKVKPTIRNATSWASRTQIPPCDIFLSSPWMLFAWMGKSYDFSQADGSFLV